MTFDSFKSSFENITSEDIGDFDIRFTFQGILADPVSVALEYSVEAEDVYLNVILKERE